MASYLDQSRCGANGIVNDNPVSWRKGQSQNITLSRISLSVSDFIKTPNIFLKKYKEYLYEWNRKQKGVLAGYTR